jgi:hypothetical protein
MNREHPRRKDSNFGQPGDGPLALFGACTDGRVAFVPCGEYLFATQRPAQSDGLDQATLSSATLEH